MPPPSVWFGSADEQIRLFLSYIPTFGVSAGIVLDRPASTDTALALNPRNTLLSFSLSSTVNLFYLKNGFKKSVCARAESFYVSYRSLQSSEHPYL